VTTNLETDELEPLGGTIIRHLSKCVVRLEKLAPGRRRATVLKHRAVAEGMTAEFRITTRGLTGEDEPVALPAASDAPAATGDAEP
jgi:DNA repair protein RadB